MGATHSSQVSPEATKFPANSLFIREFDVRDGFAADCVHSQSYQYVVPRARHEDKRGSNAGSNVDYSDILSAIDVKKLMSLNLEHASELLDWCACAPKPGLLAQKIAGESDITLRAID